MFTQEDFEHLNSMKEIQQMRWKDFEWFCKLFMESMGYESVRVTPGKYDGGIDHVAYRNGEKVFTQVKHWDPSGSKKKNHVPVEIVRALAGSMQQKQVTKGLIIATVPAFSDAQREAKNLNIEIIDLGKLKSLMRDIKPNFDDTDFVREKKRVDRFWFTRKELVQLQWALGLLFISFLWLAYRAFI